jgi:hypothetical protein
MRQEETAWDTKGPAFTVKMRGGLDAQGNLVALDFEARAADHNHLGYNEPDTVLISQLANMRRTQPARGGAATPSEMYAIPNRPHDQHVVGLPLGVGDAARPRATSADRTGRRSPFASNPFIDEIAGRGESGPAGIPSEDCSTAEHVRRQRLSNARARLPRSRPARRSTAGRPVPSAASSNRRDPVRTAASRITFRSQTVVAQIRRRRGEPAHRAASG